MWSNMGRCDSGMAVQGEFARLLLHDRKYKVRALQLDLPRLIFPTLGLYHPFNLLFLRQLAFTLLSIMKSFFPKGIPDIVPVAESEKSANDSEKEGGIVSKQPYAVDETSEDAISSDAQLGVQKIEATTSVWSTSHLVPAYILHVQPEVQ